MGVIENISHDKFPRQGQLLRSVVNVTFHFDTGRTQKGIVVRDDVESPGRTIIRLEDNRYILATECQFSPTCLLLEPEAAAFEMAVIESMTRRGTYGAPVVAAGLHVLRRDESRCVGTIGRYMICENPFYVSTSSAIDSWCVVGDDMLALLTEAIDYLQTKLEAQCANKQHDAVC